MFQLAQATGLGLYLLASIFLAGSVDAGRTYTVWIGYEDRALGLNINKNIPETVRVHPGDTVVFQQRSHDPHTVSFYRPPRPLPDLLVNGFEVNPLVVGPVPPVFTTPYNGSYFAGSGIMALESPNTKWEVPFGNVLGEFKYACSVHGLMQNGSVIVVDPSEKVPSPEDVRKQILKWKAQVDRNKGRLYQKAVRSVRPAVRNEDGTRTHYILTGYMEGFYEYLSFFKRTTTVNPGDKIVWYGSTFHTIAFLNGQPAPPLIVPMGGKLVFNPVVGAPSGGTVLSRTTFTNSGLIVDPTIEYTMTVPTDIAPGRLQYVCLPHYTSKMFASINIVKKKKPTRPHMG